MGVSKQVHPLAGLGISLEPFSFTSCYVLLLPNLPPLTNYVRRVIGPTLSYVERIRERLLTRVILRPAYRLRLPSAPIRSLPPSPVFVYELRERPRSRPLTIVQDYSVCRFGERMHG